VNLSGRDLEQRHRAAAEGYSSMTPLIRKPVGPAAPALGVIEKPAGGKSIEEIISDPAALKG